MLDQAINALSTYDVGTDPKVLSAIGDAVASSHGNAAARGELETKLVGVLGSAISRIAKDAVCRVLMQIGTSRCVPALAALLADKDNAHMARYALERIPAPEAAQALRDALSKLSGPLKIGVIASLGARGDAGSVSVLAALLADSDDAVAAAAAHGLGAIRNAEASQALSAAKPAGAQAKGAVTDARLACAERLAAAGKKADALAIYKSLTGDEQPKHVRLAATRGMLTAAGKGQ